MHKQTNKYTPIHENVHKNKKTVDIYAKSGMIT